MPRKPTNRYIKEYNIETTGLLTERTSQTGEVEFFGLLCKQVHKILD